jgi:hypothetical protein
MTIITNEFHVTYLALVPWLAGTAVRASVNCVVSPLTTSSLWILGLTEKAVREVSWQ